MNFPDDYLIPGIEPYHVEDAGIIYCADCRDILPHLPKVDLVLTDPPYGLDFNYVEYCDSRDNLTNLLIDIQQYLFNCNILAIMPGITQIGLYPQPSWVFSISWNTTGSFGKFGYSQWMPVLLYGLDLNGFGNINGITKTDAYHINGGGSVGFQRTKTEEKHTCPKPLNIIKLLVKRLSIKNDIILGPVPWQRDNSSCRQGTGPQVHRD